MDWVKAMNMGQTTGDEGADRSMASGGILKALSAAANANRTRGQFVDLGHGYRGFLPKNRADKVNDVLMGFLNGATGGAAENQDRMAAVALNKQDDELRADRTRRLMEEQSNLNNANGESATRDKLMMFAAQNGQDLSGLGAEYGPPAPKEMIMSQIAQHTAAQNAAAAQAEQALAGQDAAADQKNMIMDLIAGDKWNESNAKALGLPWAGPSAASDAVQKAPGAVQQGIAAAGAQQDKANGLIEAMKSLLSRKEASALPKEAQAPFGSSTPWMFGR